MGGVLLLGRQCEGGHEEPSCVHAGQMQVTEAEWGSECATGNESGAGSHWAVQQMCGIQMGYQRRGGDGEGKTSNTQAAGGCTQRLHRKFGGRGKNKGEQRAERQNCP